MASTVHTPAPWLHKVAPRRIFTLTAVMVTSGPRRRALRPPTSWWADRPGRRPPAQRRTRPRYVISGPGSTGIPSRAHSITSATPPQMDFFAVPLPISPSKRAMRLLRSRPPRGKPPGSLFITTLFSGFGSDLLENRENVALCGDSDLFSDDHAPRAEKESQKICRFLC